MLRTTAFAAALLSAAPAMAAEEDTQLWLGASAKVPLAEDFSVTLDGSQRFRSDKAGAHQQLVRATFELEAAEWITLGGGMAYLDSEAADETRLFQTVTLRTGPFTFRTQLEERFYEGFDRPQLRGRQRVMFTVPLGESDRLLLSTELNYFLQDQDPAKDSRVDHWRFRADWRHHLTPKIEVSAAYMAMLSPRPDAPDRLSHVPTLSLAYSF